jgi:zinc-ribbon domain
MSVEDERVCPRCGEPARDQRFCSSCGSNLSALAELPSRTAWEQSDRASPTVSPEDEPASALPSAADIGRPSGATVTSTTSSSGTNDGSPHAPDPINDEALEAATGTPEDHRRDPPSSRPAQYGGATSRLNEGAFTLGAVTKRRKIGAAAAASVALLIVVIVAVAGSGMSRADFIAKCTLGGAQSSATCQCWANGLDRDGISYSTAYSDMELATGNTPDNLSLAKTEEIGSVLNAATSCGAQ